MYEDNLRDRIVLEQFSSTDDGGGGQTPASDAWVPVLNLTCRVTQLDGKTAIDVYDRSSNEDTYRAYFVDRIPRTSGETSLHRLLRKPGQAAFRFLWQGDRTMSIMGMSKPAGGMHDHLANVFYVDCVEAPEMVGYPDIP